VQITTLSADYGVHFNTVLFPFSIIEVVSSLEKIGYDISPDIPFPRPIGRFIGSGEIARKGKVAIQVEGGEKLLAVAGVSLSSAIDSFNEFAKALNEDHKIDVIPLVRFYRIGANYEIASNSNTLKKIANIAKVPLLANFGTILGQEVVSTELKFGAKDLEPNSENWLDVSIRPNYERADRYIISIVYRNIDKAKTQAFTDHIEENIIKIVESVDR